MVVGYFCPVSTLMLKVDQTSQRATRYGPLLVCRCHNVAVGWSAA